MSPSHPADQSLSPWRISTERYLQMIRDGVFDEDDRVELINGMIVEMTPANPEHNYSLMRLHELLRVSPDEARVPIQSTIVVGSGQVFDPDFVLLKPGRDYRQRNWRADDLLLVFESAHSSLAKDRGAKLRAYAQAAVEDYWIADVKHEVLIVHRDPAGETYREINEYRKDDTVSPLHFPDISLRVGDLFE